VYSKLPKRVKGYTIPIWLAESSALTGASMDGASSPETGYILRGGLMLSITPSLTDPKITVIDDINMFNTERQSSACDARIVKAPGEFQMLGRGWQTRATFVYT
jgi:myosin-crossreactive antigen